MRRVSPIGSQGAVSVRLVECHGPRPCALVRRVSWPDPMHTWLARGVAVYQGATALVLIPSAAARPNPSVPKRGARSVGGKDGNSRMPCWAGRCARPLLGHADCGDCIWGAPVALLTCPLHREVLRQLVEGRLGLRVARAKVWFAMGRC
jgi:hypothetical protein